MTMLIYVLKSALFLALFYFLWRFLLRSQACHSANRSILLAIVLLFLYIADSHHPDQQGLDCRHI